MRSTPLRRTSLILTATLAVACAVTPASGQTPHFGLDLLPSIGYLAPAQSLGTTLQNGDIAGATLRHAPLVGLAAELRTPVPFLALRGGLLYARPDLAVSHAENQARLTPASLLISTLDLVLRAPRLGPVRPYLLLGGGRKRYDFKSSTGADDEAVYSGVSSDPTIHLGIGARWDFFGRLGATLEASDYSSEFRRNEISPSGVRDSSWQHDLNVSAGLSIRVF